MEFPFYLLPPSLATSARPSVQMYILSKDSKLLLIASRLSKSFYTRSQIYLYTQFRYHPVSYSQVINYLLTYWPLKWYYVSNSSNGVGALSWQSISKDTFYEEHRQYTFYHSNSNYNLLTHPPDSIRYILYHSNLRVSTNSWLFDLSTVEKTLELRTLCLQQDPNYIKNYLLNYLATLDQEATTSTKKVLFFLYLLLNLVLYGQESYPENVSWNQEIEEIIKSKYDKLVFYLQNN